MQIRIHDQFAKRHIGIGEAELPAMLRQIGVASLEQLIDETVPGNIRMRQPLALPQALSEGEYLRLMRQIAAKNQVFRSYIGQGYYGTHTPAAIQRNIFENPGWYTQYTPYQAEIAQGRLEALLNFQTMVSELTAMPIANASLLDEGTAAAEAMAMFYGVRNKRTKGHSVNKFFVSDQVFPQTLDVLYTRAEPIGIEIVVGDWQHFEPSADYFGILLQYPDASGQVCDYRALTARCKAAQVYVSVAADLLALTLLAPPGEWGADAVLGNTQRFGVPMGFGGPHAAYFATLDEHKRLIPGRIIGVSTDTRGKAALRMALQTREQHIRRDKATSNICTAQALLAIMASMYGVYHGPAGLKAIAERVHGHAALLAQSLRGMGLAVEHGHFFDTLSLRVADAGRVLAAAQARGINLHSAGPQHIGIALDETVTPQDLNDILAAIAEAEGPIFSPLSAETWAEAAAALSPQVPAALLRQSAYLTHPVFNSYHTETELMRYIKRLENKDLSLTHGMIALGSCTMKLNAAAELMPVSWPEFAQIHPFAPAEQWQGYAQILDELSAWLSAATGFSACSLQPNSGAQGEYAGLMCIRAYHAAKGETQRRVALIPSSAHGTNPASAVMAGMQVVVVECDEQGNIDIEDLRQKADAHAAELAALMVTYPSTHGVFETAIKDICAIVHERGGLVYMDGANMNAQVGLTSPGHIDADVCHLNLHKTFAIPHGGGGPGMGPICVNEKLKPFLPGHSQVRTGGEQAIRAVSSAPFGSASILLISYGYIRMLGAEGVRRATEYAILNANYIKARLSAHYQVLYTGENGHSAHELILDLRPFKAVASAEDVAKRLMDYGFHAPTLSFPVAGTIMIEPTESESQAELDRFCDAMIGIRQEMDEIARGDADAEQNVLHHAPHTLDQICAEDWPWPYSREKAAFPLPYLRANKFWPSVTRVNSAAGDRNLVCTCPPLSAYQD